MLYVGQKKQCQYCFFTHSASIFSPELWTPDWNPGGNSHVFILQVPIHWQGYAPSFQMPCLCSTNCTIAQNIVQSSIFIISKFFHKFVTCIIWANVNFPKNHPIESRVFPCGRTDGQTDMTKLIIASLKFCVRSSKFLLVFLFSLIQRIRSAVLWTLPPGQPHHWPLHPRPHYTPI